ncbi:Actin-like protein 10 [Balamuthia mandrillaris]
MVGSDGRFKVNPDTKDWFGCYWRRAALYSQSEPQRCIVFDCGSHTIKSATVVLSNHASSSSSEPHQQPHSKVHHIESVVAKIPSIFDLHMRRGQIERFYVGKHARVKHRLHATRPLIKGQVVDSSTLPELWLHHFIEHEAEPGKHRVLLAEPPAEDKEQQEQQRKTMIELMLGVMCAAMVCVVNAATLVLFAKGKTCGVVLSVGHEVVYVAVVWEGGVVTARRLDEVKEITEKAKTEEEKGMLAREMAKTAFELIEEVAKEDEEMKKVLLSNVVVTGGTFASSFVSFYHSLSAFLY